MPKIIPQETIADIESCLRAGMSLGEIQTKTGISKPTIANVRMQKNLDDVWQDAVKERQELKKQSRNQTPPLPQKKDRTLEDRIRAGEVLADIAKDNDTTIQAVRTYMIKGNLHEVWKSAKQTQEARAVRIERIYPGIINHILDGKDDRELAGIYDVTRQAMNDVIYRYGFRDLRKEFQKEKKAAPAIEMTSLLNCLRDINYAKCEGDQTLREAVQYSEKSSTKISIPQIFNIIELYRASLATGKKANLNTIRREVGLSHSTVAYFIDRIPSLKGRAKIRQKLTVQERGVLSLAVRSRTDLTYNDMGVILNIPDYVLGDHARMINVLRLQGSPYARKDKEWISYTKAMDYFEAKETGFTRAESMEYANIRSESLVDLVERNRVSIEREVYAFQEEVGVRKYNITLPLFNPPEFVEYMAVLAERSGKKEK